MAIKNERLFSQRLLSQRLLSQRLLSQRGQTMVEYILLLAVSVALVVTFYRSAAFQRYFGSEGRLGQQYKAEAEWGYRHAFIKGRTPESNQPKSTASEHSSYYSQERGSSRFFSASDPYK